MTEGGLLLDEEKEYRRFYRLSVWWVEHRATLRRLGYLVFAIIDACLLLFACWHLLSAFAIRYGSEGGIVLRMVALGQSDLHAYTTARAAEDLRVNPVKTFSIGDQRYDLYTTIVNPNSDWWAEVTFSFAYGDIQTDPLTSFVLPSQEKPLSELGISSSIPISDAQLQLSEVTWHRVDRHDIADYQTWSEDRLNIEIRDPAFVKEDRLDGKTYGRTTFTVLNQTAFSYYDVGLYIILKRGSSLVGVNRTTLSSLDSGEQTDVTVNWFGTLPSVTQVEVIPELNIFDLEVYKPLVGETTMDTRTRIFR